MNTQQSRDIITKKIDDKYKNGETPNAGDIYFFYKSLTETEKKAVDKDIEEILNVDSNINIHDAIKKIIEKRH